MSAIYEFFYDLIYQTLPALDVSMIIGLSSMFTFIMLGLLFAIFPIMIARLLNSKNLVKIYWIVVIVMSMSLFFVNNFPNIFHVGDTTVIEGASKNYNGYLPLIAEDTLIGIGFTYDENIYTYSIYTYNSINVNTAVIGVKGQIGDGDGENVLTFNNATLFISNIGISVITETSNDYFIDYSNGIECYIYGYSNYEVQP